MFEWLYTTITNSSVAQGVIAGMLATAPIAAIAFILKDLPLQIFNALKRYFSRNLVLLSSLDDYVFLVDQIQSHILWSRDKTVSYEKGYNISVGYGTHWGKYKGVFFKLEKSLEKSEVTREFKEKTQITFFTRKEAVLTEFLNTAQKPIEARLPKLYISEDGWWNKVGPITERSLDTVFCSEKDEIVETLRKFYNSKEYYEKRGIPYHSGLLLSGIPGTGKTSLLSALAWHFQKDIYYLNPDVLEATSIMSMFTGDWSNRLLIIEDIDVSGAPVSRDEDNKGITLSELLNTLDGIITPQGMFTIATTNHFDILDPALTRPGRFDTVKNIGKLQIEEARKMAEAYEAELPHDYVPMTGSDLRNYFLKNNS